MPLLYTQNTIVMELILGLIVETNVKIQRCPQTTPDPTD